MPGSQSVRSALESLIKSLCERPQAAAVSARQQAGVQTIFMIASAGPEDTAFLQGGDLFTSLRFVTEALGQRQHAELPCDFAIAGAATRSASTTTRGGGLSRGAVSPGAVAPAPPAPSKPRRRPTAAAKKAGEKVVRRRPAATAKRSAKSKKGK